ncbi:CLUMA_CG005064, isoform A [Clunio marinus]|uniref:CLUMA_CG005064, isoform A n=1 Tax=Clunio marinus TaxID=568069 RepID=A0A1J1HTK5_9DIPT|nr:CLUMA_CG005064, isoform A [Clunio marinus]
MVFKRDRYTLEMLLSVCSAFVTNGQKVKIIYVCLIASDEEKVAIISLKTKSQAWSKHWTTVKKSQDFKLGMEKSREPED